MNKSKKLQLKQLLTELQQERIEQLMEKGYSVHDCTPDELYELDDGDRLLEGIDIVLDSIE